MRKNQFLKEIRVYLEKAYLNLNPVEIEDILRDYEEYFRDGISEGKNEEEIVVSLGNPKFIVDEMVKSDIEDGKYTKDDFSAYFENEEIMTDKKKIKMPKLSISKNIGEIFVKMITLLFDIIYFPTVLITAIAIIVATLAMFTTLPYLAMTFSIIGQYKILLVFPVMLIIGSIILEILILKILIKAGIKLNKKIFKKNKHSSNDNVYDEEYIDETEI